VQALVLRRDLAGELLAIGFTASDVVFDLEQTFAVADDFLDGAGHAALLSNRGGTRTPQMSLAGILGTIRAARHPSKWRFPRRSAWQSRISSQSIWMPIDAS
jgi:hypothetical protein